MLSNTIKTLTNNTELINIVNRLGHGISYSILNELITENAFKIQEEQFDGKCILPVGCQKNMFTIYVADNIDTIEDGTTHNVNNLLLQFSNGSFNESAVYTSPKRKRCRRSFQAASNSSEECYYYSKRVDPSALTFPTNKEKDFMIDNCNKSNFIWSLMRKNSIPRSIPSWTGFQIVVNNNIPTLKITVGYLDCINAPVTEISTVYQVMRRASNIVDSLNLLSIVCAFDQAIYSKAVEIKWKEKIVLS